MKNRGEPFFFYMAIILIVIVISGFSAIAMIRPEGPLAIPLILHIHGAIFLGWFVLLATQARLIGAGNVSLHMRLGKASVVLTVAMIILGYIATRHAYARPDWSIAGHSHEASAIFPATDIVLFVAAYALGLLNRRDGTAHKRLMLIAGIIIIDAAMARLIFVLGAPPPMILVVEMSLVLSLVVYDFITRKRPHWASLFGVALMATSLAAKMTAPLWPWWPGFADAVFG